MPVKGITNMNADEKIKQYGKTFDVPFLTVDDLIKSHHNLREMSVEFNDDRRRVMAKIAEDGREYIFQYAIQNDYVPREKLKNMTIAELVEFLTD